MEKHPWKGLKHLSQALPGIDKGESQNGKTSLEGFETFSRTPTSLAIYRGVRMEKHPWKGLKRMVGFRIIFVPSMSEWKNIPGRVWNFFGHRCLLYFTGRGQNGKTSLEGFETLTFWYIWRPWYYYSQNGKTSLEGFETEYCPYSFQTRPRSEWKNIPGRVWNFGCLEMI